MADWAIVMEDGSKITEGPPEEALSHNKPMAWTKAMGPVNLLEVERIHFDGNQWVGIVGNQEIHLPPVDQTEEKLFLQFTPRDVTLSRKEVEGLSSRNHLSGIVRQVVSMPKREFVAIDIGQIIWAEVTAQSVRELGLQVGVEVICLIKAQSLEVVT